MYRDGNGVQEDCRKAVILLEKAVAQGNASAQCNLGVMYFHGNSVLESNKEKAAELWRAAAAQGHEAAECNLGLVADLTREALKVTEETDGR